MSNLLKRSLTGAGIVIFVMGGFWLHPITFFFTGLIIMTGSLYEYYRIIGNTGVKPRVAEGLIIAIAGYTISTLVAAEIVPVPFLLLMIPSVFLMMMIELYSNSEKPFDSVAQTIFAILYIGLPFSIFPFAAFSHQGLQSIIPNNIIFSPGIVLGFFILLWANDTGAYLMGSSIGKHRLMERISPKKTWEGFFGGVVISVIAAWLLSEWLGIVSTANWIIIAVIISLTGTYGDLIESMLKRSSGVKDSGNILPGHGGFLDRFDSTIISFPLVYLFLYVFG